MASILRPSAFKATLLFGALAGGAMALGQAPFSLWWLAVLGILGVFYLNLRVSTPLQAALLGWLVGTVYFAGSLYWIMAPFQVDAARHGWMAPFALVFLSAGLALLWGAGFGWAKWRTRAPGLALALGWGAAEMLRGYLFTGLPWGLVGYIWVDTPVAQLASIIGPYGLTFLTFLVLGGGFGLAGRQKWVALSGAAFVAVIAVVFGASQLSKGSSLRSDAPIIRLVQTNAAQREKWQSGKISLFWERNLALTAQNSDHKPDLIVWPETAVPYLMEQAGRAFDVMVQASGGVPIVAGIQREDGDGFYNSMVVLNGDGSIAQTYDKSHLVPFGEYIPFGTVARKLGLSGIADQLGGGYQAGSGTQLIDLGGLGRALPLICYEAVFPRDVHVAKDRPDWILHITNDAWFGKKAGPYQHLTQARMRAIEQGLPVVRAANTGISAAIDPYGRVIDSLPLGVAGALDVALPAPNSATVFSKTGNIPLIFFFFTLILSLSVHRYRLSR
ncbi:apolipoprotein N-acyltransferase [Falsihalocynthiibacter sp. S25ZX9]|uniref:apolipoprotein N-acyltransferase n=1 Tax=Falsihalocynthiibacter sp. S25ZX9 TaxID=3240870 RepID=UPI003510AB48